MHEGGDRSAWVQAQRLLDRADIRINGDRPWDLQVHHPQTFTRVLAQGSLGLGDSYVEGWWDCAQLDGFFTRILRAGLDAEVGWRARAWPWLRARLCNLQSCVGTFRARSNQLWQVVLSPGGVDGGYRRVS